MGLLLVNDLDSISLSLAIIMTVLMISSILLKYTSSRHTKVFNRLLHGQFGLVFLLIGLIVLHVLVGVADFVSPRKSKSNKKKTIPNKINQNSNNHNCILCQTLDYKFYNLRCICLQDSIHKTALSLTPTYLSKLVII
jgi:hypothetical protein